VNESNDLVASPPAQKPIVARRPRAKLPRCQRKRGAERRIVKIHPHAKNFPLELDALARVSVVFRDVYDFLRVAGIVGPNGEIRSSVDTLRRLADTQLRLAEKLGLTPVGLSKLKQEPDDLAAALAGVK
jgi:hypothetical protein